MRVAVACLVGLLLAGCNGPPGEAEADDPVDRAGPEGGLLPVTAPLPPVTETIPFSFDGNLGTFVHACVFPAGLCPTQTVVEDLTDLFVERPGANLTALSFEMTWQAQSPATQDLWVGAMVMTSCEGCNDTEFPDIHGPSPIRLDVQDVAVPLTADARVHIYIYNPTGFVHDPAVPGYAAASVDQDFHIEGVATVSVPAPATSSAPAA